jgi:hypothetical protein
MLDVDGWRVREQLYPLCASLCVCCSGPLVFRSSGVTEQWECGHTRAPAPPAIV